MRRKGFTLIELLIVIAIIAILAAIAIPQFARYRVRAYNGSAESDLRNARTTYEAFFADWQRYPNTATVANGEVTISHTGITDAEETFNLSTGVNFAANTDGQTDVSYTMITKHLQGDTYYGADSDVQGIYFQRNSQFIGADFDTQLLPPSTPQNDDFADAGDWILQ